MQKILGAGIKFAMPYAKLDLNYRNSTIYFLNVNFYFKKIRNLQGENPNIAVTNSHYWPTQMLCRSGIEHSTLRPIYGPMGFKGLNCTVNTTRYHTKICSYMEGKMKPKYKIENVTELVAVSYLLVFIH
jgi:hypothetical protein